ncbi:MAG: hypothetical protein ACRCT8_14595 [Lacipirellulaceae bacterium]
MDCNPRSASNRLCWLVLPPASLCTLDVGITLWGQSERYWSGDFAAVNEMSPSFAQYLAIHPLAFVAAGLVWIVLFTSVIALLPETLALGVSMAIVIGHMGGAATWLAYRFQNYQACNALFLVTAFLAVLSFKRGQNEDGYSAFDWRRTGLPSWSRWVVVTVLAAIPVWWFLVPH